MASKIRKRERKLNKKKLNLRFRTTKGFVRSLKKVQMQQITQMNVRFQSGQKKKSRVPSELIPLVFRTGFERAFLDRERSERATSELRRDCEQSERDSS